MPMVVAAAAEAAMVGQQEEEGRANGHLTLAEGEQAAARAKAAKAAEKKTRKPAKNRPAWGWGAGDLRPKQCIAWG